jgi:hypothetical protein
MTGNVTFDAIIIVVASVALSLGMLWAIRAFIPHQQLTPHNEVSGFVYAAVGVIYAVVLGFAVISVWEEYRGSLEDANQEANSVANIYRLAGALPEPSRSQIQQSALAYVNAVIDDEWSAMNEQELPSDGTVAALDQLWSEFYAAEITNARESVLYAEGLGQLHDLSAFRRDRIVSSEEGLLGVMWAVLIVGGILVVLFPCLFGVENGLVHSLIVATLAATLGLMLVLAYELNHPFRGDVRVQPDAFEQVRDQFMGDAPEAGRVGLFTLAA